MTIGEAVAALARCCSDYDELLFRKSIYSIKVNDDSIEVCFVDSNTADIRINKDGNYDYL